MKRPDIAAEVRGLFVAAASTAVIAVAVYFVITAFIAPPTPVTYVLGAIYGVTSMVVLWAIRTGRFNLGATAFVVLNWAAAAAFLILEGPHTGHVGIFFVTIILASALARPMAGALIGLGSAMVLALVAYLVAHGHFTPVAQVTAEASPWMDQVAQLVTSGVVASLIARGMARLIARLRLQTRDLAQKNEDLARQQQELSTRVREQKLPSVRPHCTRQWNDPRSWRPWGGSQAASPTISTIYSR